MHKSISWSLACYAVVLLFVWGDASITLLTHGQLAIGFALMGMFSVLWMSVWVQFGSPIPPTAYSAGNIVFMSIGVLSTALILPFALSSPSLSERICLLSGSLLTLFIASPLSSMCEKFIARAKPNHG